LSIVAPEFNRDSFDHLNTSVYDFWTAFALSLVSGLLIADFASAGLDQYGPLIKALGTLALGAAITVPAPVAIGFTILEGKDQNYIKHLMDFPLHPGGVIVDFVEQGIIDLVTSEDDVPKDPNTGQPTKEAKVPKDPGLKNEVIAAKTLGFHSFAVHVEVPQRKMPLAKLAYQPVDDIIFHSPVPRSASVVSEPGSGVFKGVALRKVAHQAVIGSTYLRSIHYTMGSKPVPVFKITFCRGISLATLKNVNLAPVTSDELKKIENAYATIGSVQLKMEIDRYSQENEELKQQRQTDVWDHHAKAAEAWRNERAAFGGEPLRQSTWKWVRTGRGLIGLIVLVSFSSIFLFFLNAWLQAKPHP
jgi:hypothetical protein